MAGLGLITIFAGGCLTEETASSGGGHIPIMLLDRNGGATHIVIYPETTEDLGGGTIRYTGTAFAQVEPDAAAGRETEGIQGTAVATVNESLGEREFSFTSSEASDLGWAGLQAAQVSIEGSGPPSAGTVSLSASATLDSSRSSAWGFATQDVNVGANLAGQSPIFVVSSEAGSVGSPFALVQAPSPGGLNLSAQAMGLIFAPVSGETSLGAVEQGQWVKFALPGTGLTDGVTLGWDPAAASLRGGGHIGRLDVPSASVDALVEITASPDASYLSFTGLMDPPQLGILNDGSGTFWTDPDCGNCADVRFAGPGISIDTINIPSLVGVMKIRNGEPVSSVITASGLNGSIGPVVIDQGSLAADFSNPLNITAELQVSGSVLGVPVTTTFSGPFSLDLAQMGVNLTGDLYLNLGDKVILEGALTAAISQAGADVGYDGDVRLPSFGGDFDVSGDVSYDLAQQSLALGVKASGSLGPVSIQGVDFQFGLVPAGGGIDVSGSLDVGSITAGKASLTNVSVDIAGNTAGAVTAAINDEANPVQLKVGDFAQVNAFGSLTYSVPSNSLAFGLAFNGRVASWQITNGQVSLNWPGSGNVTGVLSIGQITSGQVSIQDAVIDVSASASSVTAALRPTSITAGSLLSATVSGNATYNLSTSTLNLTLAAAGRVGSINVTGATATVTWPASGNIAGSVNIGNVAYGPATLKNTTIGFTANATTVSATIGSTLEIGNPFQLNIGLSGTANYNVSTNTLNVAITTGTGTMWGKAISGSVAFSVNITPSTISGSASTSSLRFSYDKFGITLTGTSLNFSVSGGSVAVSGGGNVAVNGPMGNGWLSGSGAFTVSGSSLRSTNYHITLNNMNKTITWVDVGPRNGAPLTVDISAGSLSYDAEGKMRARVDTGFPLYCEDLEFKIHAWGDQNVLRVDFEGSWIIGLFGARGHMDVYDWLSSSNPPMYGYADARITFVWFRFQTWNGQSLENSGC
ncbi:MAG: hypothetical protein DCC49_01945 [Acidobacteria bacterium]|nr:MAG: hypothetical protein DCC49_01945 [Acidobacteriota bacterium]